MPKQSAYSQVLKAGSETLNLVQVGSIPALGAVSENCGKIRIMKYCKLCSTDKPFSDFNRRGSGYQPYCRYCQSSLHREYYDSNRSKRKKQIRDRAAIHKRAAREYVLNYLSNHPCVDCGEKNRVVLQFDHVRGEKFAEISKLINNGALITTISEEIAKCDVRCANCHIIATAQRAGWYEWKI